MFEGNMAQADSEADQSQKYLDMTATRRGHEATSTPSKSSRDRIRSLDPIARTLWFLLQYKVKVPTTKRSDAFKPMAYHERTWPWQAGTASQEL